MASMQDQGVPIPDRFRTRADRAPSSSKRVVQRRTPIETGGEQTETVTDDYRQDRSSRSSRTNFSPVKAGGSAGGIGLLEAEFFGALALLILLMFAGPSDYATKIMAIMKRGTLICILFFVLAIVAGIGPNMARVSKGLGALVVVGIMLTTPFGTVLTDTDNIIKNDWVGTTERGTDVGSADNAASGGGQSSGGSGGLGLALGALNRLKELFGSGFFI